MLDTRKFSSIIKCGMKAYSKNIIAMFARCVQIFA